MDYCNHVKLQWINSPTSVTAAVPVAGALAVAKLTKSSLIWQRLEQILLKVTVPLVLALSVDGKLVFLKCDSIENC